MTPEETVKPNEQLKTPCHVHDECDNYNRESIHKYVCRNVETTEHTDGNHYCLLHLPTADKDSEKLRQIIDERFAVERLKTIGSEIPTNELKYDFRYVWFTPEFSFQGRLFRGNADFTSAIFSGSANFKSVTFQGQVNFMSSVFSGSVDFDLATFERFAMFRGFPPFKPATFKRSVSFRMAMFKSDADFTEVIFEDYVSFGVIDNNLISVTTFDGNAMFNGAKFFNYVDFRYAVFNSQTGFHSTKFCVGVDFFSSKFQEKSQTYFYQTLFCSSVRFAQTEFDGFVEFTGDVFLNEESVQRLKASLKADRIEEGQETFLDLGKSRLNKPERISFNSMKLRPSWFVGAEVRNLVFNDVEWLNLEIDVDKSGLDAEFKNLTDRNVGQPKESLIKACNQLADNAEANRRFEEAKQFRKQSIALRKHYCHIHDAVQLHKKDDIRQKVCGNFPVVNEDGGQYYCLWHNPDKNKAEIFLQEFIKKQAEGHTDFRAVVFPITVEYAGKIELPTKIYDYTAIKYYKNKIEVLKLPQEINFTGATFQRSIVFEYADIHNLNFNESYFEEDAKLEFKDSTTDGMINLDKAVFEGKLFFNGNYNYEFFVQTEKGLSMKDARFDNPQNANFRNIRLRPHYFADVDVSKFTFYNCRWTPVGGKQIAIQDEIKVASEDLISQTCNQLAINYEETRNYGESSYFRFTAMEAKRLSFKTFYYSTRIYSLFWLYKFVSGYGERWLWALGVLLALLIGFGVLFWSPISTFDYGEQKTTKANDEVEQLIYQTASYGERFRSMTIQDGLVHSLSIATFQRPEPKAYGFWTKLFVALEVILAPLQAALLALAIRRKFMR